MKTHGVQIPIRLRLTLWSMVLLAAILTSFSGVLYVALRVTLYDNLDDTLDGSAALISGLHGTDSGGVPQPLLESDNPTEGESFWRILDLSGQVERQAGIEIAGYPAGDPDVIQAALDGQEVFQTVQASEGYFRVYTAPIIRDGRVAGIVQQGLALDDVLQILAAFRVTFALGLPAALLLTFAGGQLLARRALGPVDAITRAARSISARDLSQRLHMDLPDDELGRLARTFDAMIERLDDSFRRQRRFTADASHELRTPLTVIKGDVSLALTRPRDADHYRHVLSELDEEVDQMLRLVERLLALARTDVVGWKVELNLVDVSGLLTDLCDQMAAVAGAKGLELVVQIAPSLTAQLDWDAVSQILLNLLDNAFKYTPAPGRVRVSCHRSTVDSSMIDIAVSDSGKGIPAEHLSRIFDRFYRVDSARSRELGGAGLGLAIAREFAMAHGGDLLVHSVPGEGSTFTLRLPA